MANEGLIARLARTLRSGDPLKALTEGFAPTDLQALMLHVYRERSARRTPAELLSQYESSKRVQPAPVDARALVMLEAAALECAQRFEPLELSPCAPLGLNSVLGRIDQNNCLATVRGMEVLADSTTVLALECARRRRSAREAEQRLCARGRMLRLQPFDHPAFWPHFGLFVLVTGGRDRGSLAFELENLREHLEVHLRFLERLPALGCPTGTVDVALSDTESDERRLSSVEEHVLKPLASRFPQVRLRLDRAREQGRGYYRGLCLRIDLLDAQGGRVNVGDGGFTDWTQRLLSDSKERLLTSALGLQMLARPNRLPLSRAPA